jgi:hypothetical protein
MEYNVKRTFAHRTYGAVGAVHLKAEIAKVSLDGKELPGSSVEYLLNFALQNLQDAYAGAKDAQVAQGLFAKKYDALTAGTIGVRSAGTSVGEETRVARQIVKRVLKGQLAEADFAALTDERLDEVFKKNEAKLAPLVEERLAELKRERERKAKLGAGLEVDL